MLGSVDAPEPGFRLGARWGVFARWAPGFVLAHAGGWCASEPGFRPGALGTRPATTRTTLTARRFRPGARWGVVPRWHPPNGKPIGNPPLDTHIIWLYYLAVASGPGGFLSVVRSSERLRWQHSPGIPRGGGAHGHPGMPGRRPRGAWQNCSPFAEYSPQKFIGGLSRTVMDGGRTLRHLSAAVWAAGGGCCVRTLRPAAVCARFVAVR